MTEQCPRRAVLGLLGSAGVAGLAGCLGGESVSVLAAGSLGRALEERLGPAFADESGTTVHGEYHGSAVVVGMVRDQQANPDVAISADAGLLRDRLYPEHATWDVVFGANEVGLAYNPETGTGARLDAGDPWHEVLRAADSGEVAISDPDLDPLGYRAVHLLALAEQYYGVDGLREGVLADAYREPTEQRLLAGVETGNRAVAVAYRNMARDRDLPFYELPAALNFSDPAHAERYASVAYTTDDGYTVRGSPTLYSATVLESADDPDAGEAFVQFLLDSPGLLRKSGLAVPAALPRSHGQAPERLRRQANSEASG